MSCCARVDIYAGKDRWKNQADFFFSHLMPPTHTVDCDTDYDTLKYDTHRWTLATCLKFCMAGKAPVDALSPHMKTFLQMMTHEDLDVKKAALLMVNAAVHHQVQYVLKYDFTSCVVLGQYSCQLSALTMF